MKFNLAERKIIANIEGFIIPNNVNLFKDFMLKEHREPKYKRMLELSGIEKCNLDEQPMVQMWYVGVQELHSDNLADHGFRIIDNGTRYSFTMNGLNYLPYCFLKDKKEGDIIKVTFPIKLYTDDESEANWTLEATIKLNQTDYRYRRFGRFEDVLERLVS